MLGWTDLLLRTWFSGVQFYLIGHAKSKSMCTSDRETTLNNNFVLCYINRARCFHFYCNCIKRFCSETLAMRMLVECLKYNVSQRVTLVLHTHPSKGVQKNMLKASIFKYKLCIISFDNNTVFRKTAEQTFWRATLYKYFW